MVPHAALAYIALRDPARFPRAAAMTYAVFDVGATAYWLAPTAPPWYAAMACAGPPRDTRGAAPRAARVEPAARRMMAEYGEHFWGDGWGPLSVCSEATHWLRCPRCTSPHR